MLEVTYATNIIVAVHYQHKWCWYVTEKELWFMDRIQWGLAFGRDLDFLSKSENHVERFNMPVLDEKTADKFLLNIRPHQVFRDDLRRLVVERFTTSLDWAEDVIELHPAVLIDFNSRQLKSLFPEPSGRFEKYVPSGWQGTYENFLDDIPIDQQYWLVANKNYFDLVK